MRFIYYQRQKVSAAKDGGESYIKVRPPRGHPRSGIFCVIVYCRVLFNLLKVRIPPIVKYLPKGAQVDES